MEPLIAAAREAALHVFEGVPLPEAVPPPRLFAVHAALAQALDDAMSIGMDLTLIRKGAGAAKAAYLRTQSEALAAHAAQHNASVGPDGPRLLPLCLELQVAVVNKAPSDRYEPRGGWEQRGNEQPMCLGF